MKKIYLSILIGTIGCFIQAQVPTAGLIAWYPFNGNLLDSTANNNDLQDLTLNGGLNYVAGHNGLAINYEQGGSCDVPGVPYLANMNNNNFTVAGWVNFRDTINVTPLVIAVGRNDVTNFAVFSLEYYASGTSSELSFYTYYDFTYSSLQVLPVNVGSYVEEWYHFAFSFQGGDSIRAYVNGVLLNITPTTSDTLNANLTKLEFGAPGTYCNSIGSTDDFVLYNRALTGAEVAQLASSPSTGIATQNNPKFVMYPNPSSDIMQINWNGISDVKRIEISTVDGRVLRYYTSQLSSLMVSDLLPGIYLLRVYSGQNIYTSKFVKK